MSILNNNSESVFGRMLAANCGSRLSSLKRYKFCQKTDKIIFFRDYKNTNNFIYISEYIRLLNGKYKFMYY